MSELLIGFMVGGLILWTAAVLLILASFRYLREEREKADADLARKYKDEI